MLNWQKLEILPQPSIKKIKNGASVHHQKTILTIVVINFIGPACNFNRHSRHATRSLRYKICQRHFFPLAFFPLFAFCKKKARKTLISMLNRMCEEMGVILLVREKVAIVKKHDQSQCHGCLVMRKLKRENSCQCEAHRAEFIDK